MYQYNKTMGSGQKTYTFAEMMEMGFTMEMNKDTELVDKLGMFHITVRECYEHNISKFKILEKEFNKVVRCYNLNYKSLKNKKFFDLIYTSMCSVILYRLLHNPNKKQLEFFNLMCKKINHPVMWADEVYNICVDEKVNDETFITIECVLGMNIKQCKNVGQLKKYLVDNKLEKNLQILEKYI